MATTETKELASQLTSLPPTPAERAELVESQTAAARRLLAADDSTGAAAILEQALRSGLWRYSQLWAELAHVLGGERYGQLRDLWWDSPRACHSRISVLRTMAEAARVADEQEDARVLLRKAILLQSARGRHPRARLSGIKRTVTNQRRGRTSNHHPGVAEEALRSVNAVLAQCGARGFLILNTLRDSRTGDSLTTPVTLGVLASEVSLNDLETAMNRTEGVAARWADPSSDVLRVKHAGGAVVEIYLHYRDDETQRQWRADGIATWTYPPFDIQPWECFGSSLFVPADMDRHLSESFGPEQAGHGFDPYLDAPNVEVKDQSRLVTVLCLRLLDAMTDRDNGRRRRYVALLRTHGEGEWLDRL